MNRPNRPAPTVSERRASSVSTQTSLIGLWLMMAVVAAVVALAVAFSKWRSASADQDTLFGIGEFNHEFDFLASIGDIVLGANWIEFTKNVFILVVLTVFAYLLRPVLPIGRDK